MELILKKKMSYFFSICFNIYLIVLIFDPMRESLNLGALNSMISALRDLLILVLFCVIVLCKKKKNYSIYFLLFVLCFLLSSILCKFSPYGLVKNIIFSYSLFRTSALIFVITNLEDYYEFDIIFLTKYYIIIAVIDYVVSFYIYMFKPNLMIKFHLGRISVGNPSIQSIIFLTSFVLSFYFQPFRKLINILVSFILFVATISTVTSTAFVGIVIFFCFTVWNKKYLFSWLWILGILFILINYFLVTSKIDFTTVITIFQRKMDGLLNYIMRFIEGEKTTRNSGASMNNREMEKLKFIQQIKMEDLFFGNSSFSMIDPENMMIENTYWGIISDFGITGLLVFLSLLFNKFIDGVKLYFRTHEVIIFVNLGIVISYCFTLYLFGGTGMIIQFVFFYYLSIRLLQTRKKMS